MSVLVVVSAIVMMLGSSRSVVAEDRQPPCLADVQRLCGSVPPTGDFVQTCLEGQRDQLSAKCRKHVGDFTHDTGALTSACQSDLAKLCGDSTEDAGSRESCLVAHRDKLSERCRTTFDDQTRDE